ncbi:hypothetical protein D3C73_1659470 [compost metagenome]
MHFDGIVIDSDSRFLCGAEVISSCFMRSKVFFVMIGESLAIIMSISNASDVSMRSDSDLAALW